MDIKIREQKERINALDTTSKEKYSEELNKEVLNLVKMIPMQNRMALTIVTGKQIGRAHV